MYVCMKVRISTIQVSLMLILSMAILPGCTEIRFKDNNIQNISQEKALSNAPEKDSDYILVPKVLDK